MISVITNMDSLVHSVAIKIDGLAARGEMNDRLLRTVTSGILPVMKTRIHEQGLATDGTSIGKYSKKPIYVSITGNPGSAKAFGTPTGKPNAMGIAEAVFQHGPKKGQAHKSKYFPGGYDEFKTAIGRNELGSVNLSLSGQLNSQLKIIPTETGEGYGWDNKKQLDIALAMERKYGKKIWGLSEEEEKLVGDIVKEFISDAFSS
jgi:hypothetical protein